MLSCSPVVKHHGGPKDFNMLAIFEPYVIELILLGGFFLAGPLARLIESSVTGEPPEDQKKSYRTIRRAFRLQFAALLGLWLLLDNLLFP